MEKSFLVTYGRKASIVLIVLFSLGLVALTGFQYGIVGLLPIVFGLLFVYVPVDNFIISSNRPGRLTFGLASVQLLANVVVGSLLTAMVFVAAWKARFCQATLPTDGGFRCEDNIHDLFTLELTHIQSTIFDGLHVGSIWFYIPVSIILSSVLALYLRIKPQLKYRLQP